MAYRRRRPANKGKKCQRRKRVRVKGQGMAWRCASFTRKRKPTTYRKRRRATRRRRPTKRRASGMAKRGSRCTGGFKRVRSFFGGTVRRCKRYGR